MSEDTDGWNCTEEDTISSDAGGATSIQGNLVITTYSTAYYNKY